MELKSNKSNRLSIKHLSTDQKIEVSKIVSKSFEKKFTKQVDHKFFDTTASGTVDNTGDLFDICTINVGDTVNTRDGNTIRVFSIEFRYSWFVDPASGGNTCRFLVFRWRGDDSVDVPTLASVLEAADPLSPYNFESLRQKRLIVLHDTQNIISDLAPAVCTEKWITNQLHFNINYNTGFTTGTDKIFFLAMTDAGSDPPVIRMRSRVVFTDA